jgi:hypothetical protein
MSDNLDAAIASKSDEVRKLERRLEVARIELRVLQQAAALRPGIGLPPTNAASIPLRVSTGQSKGGRQQGAIAKEWRNVLQEIVDTGNVPLDIDMIAQIAETTGINIKPRSLRERIRRFSVEGHLAEQDGRFVVSEEAIRRFNLSTQSDSPSDVAASEGECRDEDYRSSSFEDRDDFFDTVEPEAPPRDS